jgi:hypothetical protein
VNANRIVGAQQVRLRHCRERAVQGRRVFLVQLQCGRRHRCDQHTAEYPHRVGETCRQHCVRFVPVSARQQPASQKGDDQRLGMPRRAVEDPHDDVAERREEGDDHEPDCRAHERDDKYQRGFQADCDGYGAVGEKQGQQERRDEGGGQPHPRSAELPMRCHLTTRSCSSASRARMSSSSVCTSDRRRSC